MAALVAPARRLGYTARGPNQTAGVGETPWCDWPIV
jgi:hypothetical protein